MWSSRWFRVLAVLCVTVLAFGCGSTDDAARIDGWRVEPRIMLPGGTLDGHTKHLGDPLREFYNSHPFEHRRRQLRAADASSVGGCQRHGPHRS
jgi:hypothetical protein